MITLLKKLKVSFNNSIKRCMKQKILKFLCCPSCYDILTLKVEESEGEEVKEGVLECPQGHSYPITNFIPCLIVKKGKKASSHNQVKESFSTKWQIGPQYSKKYKDFFDDWFRRKVGIPDKKDFADYFSNKEMMLDAGTGLGPKVTVMAKLSKGEVFGIDIAEGSVAAAYRHSKKYPNAHIIQADIFHLPFKKAIFDFIVSDGVLHHTPDTRKAFLALVPFLAKGGDIAIHVYKKMEPIREFTDDFIREYATKLTPEQCYEFCKPFTKLGKSLDGLNVEIEVPQDIPILEIKKGKYPLQRFIYYTMFQCFWNPNISFKENNLVNFDWFHPQYAWRYTPEEVRTWFKEAKLRNIRRFITNPSGISMLGTK